VSTGGGRPWEAHLPVTVYAHLHAETALSHRRTDRAHGVALHLAGTNSADLVLFTERADLVRLIETATAALADLDATTTTATAPESIGSIGSTGTADTAA
jgi:hypothetical protein